ERLLTGASTVSLHDALPIGERLGKEVRVQEREALMKEREHLEPPAETDQAVEDPLLGRNEEVNQEWDLIRVLIEHGHKPLRDQRSEEHTSELQSRENLVCRL